ncbi:hypothetical protein XH86_13120 [Bradyrhizobium guangdongense]|uniref:Uncharacterized protein n=1 Tax=Bradyrhizobium guangdongense TaxID=1325090 RepID=A0A7S7ZQN0_9BRAD|nr:hypothetical protein XH86_13120 [Bradyrhizobium guangdongense]
MRFAFALLFPAALLHVGPADAQATRLRVEHGKFIVAQSYCGMCTDVRTACVLKCNGAGGCIQRCDDEFLYCREQNCGRR